MMTPPDKCPKCGSPLTENFTNLYTCGSQMVRETGLLVQSEACKFATGTPTKGMHRPRPSTLIIEECDAIKGMLIAKNDAYGNSALNPVRCFSKANSVEQIRVRIDDKISRLMRGGSDDGEDTELDLIGYLILLRVAKKMESEANQNDQSRG